MWQLPKSICYNGVEFPISSQKRLFLSLMGDYSRKH